MNHFAGQPETEETKGTKTEVGIKVEYGLRQLGSRKCSDA
jgi:hypothetical protein